jgi:flagellar motor switch/type III secretory pathway protein FliN
MAHAFAAARPAAQHCPELTARGPRPGECATLLAAWRRDLARLLADDLAALLSGDRLSVTVSAPEPLSGEAVLARIGPLAANSLLRCGASAQTVLVSFDFATAAALTDRSFGGEGTIAGPAPEHLPRSAALLIDEAAAMIACAITQASLGDVPPPGTGLPRSEVMVRSDSAARLKPFTPDAPCALFTLAIANPDGCEWRALLAMGEDQLARLLPQPGPAPLAARQRRGARTPASGTAAPFAAIPLPLKVVLAEFDLPLARLQTLVPGDEIPLAIARQVPLRLGDAVIGHGSIGAVADRMAIRLTCFPAPAQESLT